MIDAQTTQIKELTGRAQTLSVRNQRQESSIQEKDQSIASGLAAIQDLGTKLLVANEEKERLAAIATNLERRLAMLKSAVARCLHPDDPHELWKVVHLALSERLTREGYQARSGMAWWDPVRWFGGGDSLPMAFFLPLEELPNRDVGIRKQMMGHLRRVLGIKLKPALEEAHQDSIGPTSEITV
jgi:hypothetical protein